MHEYRKQNADAPFPGPLEFFVISEDLRGRMEPAAASFKKNGAVKYEIVE